MKKRKQHNNKRSETFLEHPPANHVRPVWRLGTKMIDCTKSFLLQRIYKEFSSTKNLQTIFFSHLSNATQTAQKALTLTLTHTLTHTLILTFIFTPAHLP
jgi:hypothetical protein